MTHRKRFEDLHIERSIRANRDAGGASTSLRLLAVFVIGGAFALGIVTGALLGWAAL